MRSGDEYDALTRAKRNYFWRPGLRRWIKRKFNKRARKSGRQLVNAGETK